MDGFVNFITWLYESFGIIIKTITDKTIDLIVDIIPLNTYQFNLALFSDSMLTMDLQSFLTLVFAVFYTVIFVLIIYKILKKIFKKLFFWGRW